MSLFDKLERVFGRLAIPSLPLVIVIGQVFVLATSMFRLIDAEKLAYYPILVAHGEWWRIFSFMFIVPIPTSPLGYVFLAFGWYLFFLMGNALEQHWGVFRFNVFLFVSYALTVSLAFITPRTEVTNLFILGSVFLAFAYLNPDFEMLLFFVLPVKIKWLALITWVLYAVQFFRGDLAARLQIGAATLSYLLFFGADIFLSRRYRANRARQAAQRAKEVEEPRHVCHVCGKTDKSHPQLDFRYCSKCAGDQCYCPEHIQNHAHVVPADDGKGR
jgi:hypothetical protein